mgnify:CR=1 FL=1
MPNSEDIVKKFLASKLIMENKPLSSKGQDKPIGYFKFPTVSTIEENIEKVLTSVEVGWLASRQVVLDASNIMRAKVKGKPLGAKKSTDLKGVPEITL